MRIAVIGAGGIGAIYGAALAKAGADVTFIARGAHLAAMQQDGLKIEGDRGEFTVWVDKNRVSKKGLFRFPSDLKILASVQEALIYP